ncbi:MAG TPA: histidine triad nucleotide-binding protein [Thermodesulfobacteriota bacterium]|nr:histidine triad nucleotide-binding protein [Thermodesulfobacteriota bacterium]
MPTASPTADCVFCKIVAKELPARIVHEDDRLIAFEDIQPRAPVHLLVTPKRHIPTVLDLTEADRELVGAIVLLASRLARERGVAERGFRLVVNANREAGQTVFHLHFHLLAGRPLGAMG